MEVTDRTEAAWEQIMDTFTDRPAARQRRIGLARVRELAAQTMPIMVAPNRPLADVLREAADKEGYGPGSRRDAYYTRTHGGDWPEDH